MYAVKRMCHAPILSEHLRALRRVMDMTKAKDLAMWALWVVQWQGMMRASDVLNTATDAKRRWNPLRDSHLGRLSWEHVDAISNAGYGTWLRWRLKPSKTDQAGENRHEKTFLVDESVGGLSAGKAIKDMLSRRTTPARKPLESLPIFSYAEDGSEVKIEDSRSYFMCKLKEAGLNEQFLRGYSLRIGGATAYANSGPTGHVLVGFMRL